MSENASKDNKKKNRTAVAVTCTIGAVILLVVLSPFILGFWWDNFGPGSRGYDERYRERQNQKAIELRKERELIPYVFVGAISVCAIAGGVYYVKHNADKKKKK